MKVYTGCFDNLEYYLQEGLNPININPECPVYFEGRNWLCFAPELISYIKFKNKEIGHFQYHEEFSKKLDSLNKEKCRELVNSVENVVLLSVEPMGVPSHRHQVADWLEQNLGVVCDEYPEKVL